MRIDADSFAAVTRDEAAAEFLRGAAHYPPEEITPALATAFERITLVNHARTERLTIDWNLRFTDVQARSSDERNRCAAGIDDGALSIAADYGGVTASIAGMVIVEPEAGRHGVLAHEAHPRAVAHTAAQGEQVLHRHGVVGAARQEQPFQGEDTAHNKDDKQKNG